MKGKSAHGEKPKQRGELRPQLRFAAHRSAVGSTEMWFDVRSPSEFGAQRHSSITPGSGLNVPLETLGERWFELPPPQTMGDWTWVVRDDAQKSDLLTAIRTRFEGPCPYPVNVMVWADELELLTKLGCVTSAEFVVAPLWRPSPSLAAAIDAIEASLTAQGIGTPWTAADIGCGSGRDAAFLVSRGCWRVVCVDQSPALLAKAVTLCTRYTPSASSCADAAEASRVSTIQVDLANDADCSDALARLGQVHLLHVSRFLHKPLLPKLPVCVAPGGWVVYMSFADGAQFIGKCTPKHPKHLVFPGEMAAVFSDTAGFIAPPFRDAVIPIEDGRPACDFVAQKARHSEAGDVESDGPK